MQAAWGWSIAVALAAEAPATIEGRVVARGSGVPLAEVEVRAGDRVTTTGPDGRFWLEVSAGEVEVSLRPSSDHVGATFVQTVEPGEALDVTWRLEPAGGASEVTVFGDRDPEDAGAAVISIEELRRIPGSFGDPIRALQSLPSVSRPNALEGDIVVRGQEGLNTGTFVDGVRVPFLFHLLVGRSVLDPHMLQEVEFYPGGMPSRFGDVTAGVVNARTSFEPAEPGVHGTAHADLLDVGATVNAQLGRDWTLRAGGRQSWVSGLIALGTAVTVWTSEDYDRGERPPTVALPYNDLQVRLIRTAGEGERWSLTLLQARDGVELVPARDDDDGDGRPDPVPPPPAFLPFDPNELVSNGFVRVVARRDLSRGRRDATTWVAVGSERQHNLVPGLGILGSGPQFGEVRAGLYQLRHDARVPAGERWAVRGGGDVRLQPSTVRSYLEAFSIEDVQRTVDERLWVSPFAELQGQLGRWWVAPGVRGSLHQFSGTTWWQAEPRLTVRRSLSDAWTVTTFAGRFTQQPPPDRLAAGIGNPDIGLIRAWQGSVGLQGRWPSGWLVDLTAYASRIDGLVVQDTRVEISRPLDSIEDTVAEPTIVPSFDDVVGHAVGVEAQVRMQPVGGWFGWIGFTGSRALRTDADGSVFPGDYDVPLSVVAVLARDLPRRWSISGRVRAGSGQPFTPLQSVFLPEEDLYTGLQGPRNSERFPWFKQVDLRIDKTWLGKRTTTMLYLDVFNALNHKNYLQATYNYDLSELQRLLWIPVLPTIGVEVTY